MSAARRHVLWWFVALAPCAVALIDTTSQPADEADPWAAALGTVLAAVAIGMAVYAVRKRPETPRWQNLSRAAAPFVFLLGCFTVILWWAQADVRVCDTGACENQTERASPRDVIAGLSWEAADVIPVLEIPETLNWDEPVRSTDPVYQAAVFVIRIMAVAVVVTAVAQAWQGLTEPDARSDPAPGV